jgi:hypothetical protein
LWLLRFCRVPTLFLSFLAPEVWSGAGCFIHMQYIGIGTSQQPHNGTLTLIGITSFGHEDITVLGVQPEAMGERLATGFSSI